MFKEYEFQNVDNKLFQTRIFFPSNSVPGKYEVAIYQVKNQIIRNKQISYQQKNLGLVRKFINLLMKNLQLMDFYLFFATISGLIAATVLGG